MDSSSLWSKWGGGGHHRVHRLSASGYQRRLAGAGPWGHGWRQPLLVATLPTCIQYHRWFYLIQYLWSVPMEWALLQCVLHVAELSLSHQSRDPQLPFWWFANCVICNNIKSGWGGTAAAAVYSADESKKDEGCVAMLCFPTTPRRRCPGL